MPDRIEREIEEILSKLDDLPAEGGGAADRKPVSILAHRASRKTTAPSGSPRAPGLGPVANLNPSTFLLAGAGTVIGGLLLSNLWAPLIWAAFGGVVVFIGGFVSALFRRPKAPGGAPSSGTFWRDRYINTSPQSNSAWGRLTSRLRRR